jgi:hypothetical protein
MNEQERRARANSGTSGFAEFLSWLLALAFIGMIVVGVGMAVFEAYGR